MGLTLFDPRTGRNADFKPAHPSRAGLEAASGGARERAVHAAAAGALAFLGLEPVPGAELRVGGDRPADSTAWLVVGKLNAPVDPGPAVLSAKGFSTEDFHYLCLKTHYRKPLEFSWEALAAARAEREDLLRAAAAHAGVALEPSPRGRAGYLHRFRDSLSKDLDFGDALACVWDGLRPGALSPGSRAALLRETLPALGIKA